ncbi:MAG: PilZ domain-containing protein [Myxococcota bacterium]
METPAHFRADDRRRVGKSLQKRLPVRYRIGAARQGRAELLDLGPRGAFLATARPPDVGVSLVLELRSPTAWDPLQLPSEVRWVAPQGALEAGFGVRFGELSESRALALQELLETLEFEAESGGNGD